MSIKLLRLASQPVRILLPGLLGAVVVIVTLVVGDLNSRPDLKVWHRAVLDQEFSVNSRLESFSAYLALEDRLFDQLDTLVYQKIAPEDRRKLNRYYRGSFSDPGLWPTNWNRTFVLPAPDPAIRVLLLHGMSDSPYSMRSIGEFLHRHGAYVIGLRLPGHGQAPSGLLNVKWEDMAAAVRLAMQELREKSHGSPLYIVGYSNGGALAVQYVLDSLANGDLTPVDGVALLSPEIGISKLAALAQWQERLGHLLGMEKLAWNVLLPEYDPWKYGSFALNAGKQAYLITNEIQKQIRSLEKAGKLNRMPPVLAFQSVVDATVSGPAVVDNFFRHLPESWQNAGTGSHAGYELVLFDINREVEIEPLLKSNPSAWIDPMLMTDFPNFKLTLMSNRHQSNKHLAAFSRLRGSPTVEICDTGLSWPQYVFSLTHVALPFPPDDPVYGDDDAKRGPGINLGGAALRGERNVLLVPAADMLRLRYNPFHEYMEEKILAFMGLGTGPDMSCSTETTAQSAAGG